MKTARDLMTADPAFLPASASATEAARTMADREVGSVPVCDPNGRVIGVITDRDLTLRILAEGRSADVELSGLLDERAVVTVDGGDSVDSVIRTMTEHAVRRVPVVDETGLIGMISQADIARAMPNDSTGGLVDAISSAPPST